MGAQQTPTHCSLEVTAQLWPGCGRTPPVSAHHQVIRLFCSLDRDSCHPLFITGPKPLGGHSWALGPLLRTELKPPPPSHVHGVPGALREAPWAMRAQLEFWGGIPRASMPSAMVRHRASLASSHKTCPFPCQLPLPVMWQITDFPRRPGSCMSSQGAGAVYLPPGKKGNSRQAPTEEDGLVTLHQLPQAAPPKPPGPRLSL